MQPQLNFSSRIKFFRAKMRRTLSMRVRLFGGGLGGEDRGVCTLCTPWALDLVVLVAGLARTQHVSGGAQCFQGLEPGSSPTSGTCFPCSGAFWSYFVCTLCTLSPLI